MLEIIESKSEDGNVISMADMKPMQVGVVTDGDFEGAYVIRTQSTDSDEFEVMDISNPDSGSNFNKAGAQRRKVRLLKKGESITLKLFNE